MRYKAGDIVIIRSRQNKAIPELHVKLIKHVTVKAIRIKRTDWSGYSGWECILTSREEADTLRKVWGIPFEFPNKIETFVYDEEIVRKPRRRLKKHRGRSRH